MSNPKPLDLSRFEGHTPGPWRSEPSWSAVGAPDGCILFDYFGANETDISLAAAAPELLAEVVRLRAHNARLQEELYLAVPFVEDALSDDAYKKGYVQKALDNIMDALAEQEGDA